MVTAFQHLTERQAYKPTSRHKSWPYCRAREAKARGSSDMVPMVPVTLIRLFVRHRAHQAGLLYSLRMIRSVECMPSRVAWAIPAAPVQDSCTAAFWSRPLWSCHQLKVWCELGFIKATLASAYHIRLNSSTPQTDSAYNSVESKRIGHQLLASWPLVIYESVHYFTRNIFFVSIKLAETVRLMTCIREISDLNILRPGHQIFWECRCFLRSFRRECQNIFK
jgi:hypothetical protein